MLNRLIGVADLAAGAGVALVPTLFTGHMSGVNWIPAWALGGADRDDRFRVVSDGRVSESGLRNWYSDPLVARAQVSLATATAGALAGHEAVWMWDLGNENSNCVIPPTGSSAREWLRQIVSAIRTADPKARVTVGLHMEDMRTIACWGHVRPRRRVTSSRCTAIPSTPAGRTALRTSTSCRSWPTSRAGSPADATCCSRRPSLHLPPGRSGRRGGQGIARAPTSRSRPPAYTRTSARGVAPGRLRGRDALVLLRLRLRHLGRPAARPRGPPALVRALASQRLAQALRRCPGGIRRRSDDSAAQPNTRGSISNPTSTSSPPEVELPRLYGLYRTSEQGARAG